MLNQNVNPQMVQDSRQLNLGSAVLNGQSPYGTTQQQFDQSNAKPVKEEVQPTPEEELAEVLKEKQKAISNSNKVKQLTVKIHDELQKGAQLDQQVQTKPQALPLVTQLLREGRRSVHQ